MRQPVEVHLQRLPVVSLLLLILSASSASAVVPQIASSDSHTLVLRADGTLWAWGDNAQGVLGDGTTQSRPSPVFIGQDFAQITSGRQSSYAIKSDGTLWGWGANERGQLGDGGIGDRLQPVLIGSGFSVVSANWSMAVAVKEDGSLWSWGGAAFGGLGDGRMEPHFVTRPQLIGEGYRTVHTSMNHVLAIKLDGSLWSWGTNDSCQLGTGEEASYCESRALPTKIADGFVAVSAGEGFSFGIRTDGSLWSWGSNALGQLGVGVPGSIKDPASTLTTQFRSRPVRVAGQNYIAVTNGSFHAHALTADGTLWGWGYGGAGALGDGLADPPAGTPHAEVSPKKIGEGYWLTTRGGGNNNGFAIKFDGSVWAWGTNAGGQLGDGTTQDRLVPTPLGFNVFSAMGLVVSANASGPLERRTVQASLAPNQFDAGRQGCIFVGAVLANASLYTLAASGWQPHRPEAPRAYFCGKLLAYQDTLLRDADLREVPGSVLYVGYGRGDTPASSFADMLHRSLFAPVHTVR